MRMSPKHAVLALCVGTAFVAASLTSLRPSQSAARSPLRCRFTSDDGANHGMVRIPAGDYDEGDTVYPEELPIVRVHTKGFWMDRHEVTNRQFAAFVTATGYVTDAERPLNPATHPDLPAEMLKAGAVVFSMPTKLDGMQDIAQWWRYTPGANWRHPAGPGSSIAGREDFPVVEVTHDDALRYAQWLHRDLPTEAEWEWAARAGNPKASLDHDQPKKANTWEGIFPVVNSGADGFVGLAPSGCYAPNRFGLYDMIGNVWELTSDIYRPRHDDPPKPDAAPMRDITGLQYVIKGGSFLCAPNYCARYRSGAREGQEADLAASHLGFRTILRSEKAP